MDIFGLCPCGENIAEAYCRRPSAPRKEAHNAHDWTRSDFGNTSIRWAPRDVYVLARAATSHYLSVRSARNLREDLASHQRSSLPKNFSKNLSSLSGSMMLLSMTLASRASAVAPFTLDRITTRLEPLSNWKREYAPCTFLPRSKSLQEMQDQIDTSTWRECSQRVRILEVDGVVRAASRTFTQFYRSFAINQVD